MDKVFKVSVLVLFNSLIMICCKEKIDSFAVNSKVSSAQQQAILDTVSVKKSKNDQLTVLNTLILKALSQGKFDVLQNTIHPEKGVRFSMYAYVSDEDKVFTADDFKKYAGSPVKFTWGKTDGEGKNLILSLPEYLRTWVYRRNFADSKLSINTFQGSGNSKNNLKKKYPGADFTENYISGSEKYSGMDWNSLRLVFEKFKGKYYLVGVINDQWTI